MNTIFYVLCINPEIRLKSSISFHTLKHQRTFLQGQQMNWIKGEIDLMKMLKEIFWLQSITVNGIHFNLLPHCNCVFLWTQVIKLPQYNLILLDVISLMLYIAVLNLTTAQSPVSVSSNSSLCKPSCAISPVQTKPSTTARKPAEVSAPGTTQNYLCKRIFQALKIYLQSRWMLFFFILQDFTL